MLITVQMYVRGSQETFFAYYFEQPGVQVQVVHDGDLGEA